MDEISGEVLDDRGFEQWMADLEGMGFEERADAISEKIMEGIEDPMSREFFERTYKYVKRQYKNRQPLELKEYYDRIIRSERYGKVGISEFGRIMTLIELCGYGIENT